MTWFGLVQGSKRFRKKLINATLGVQTIIVVELLKEEILFSLLKLKRRQYLYLVSEVVNYNTAGTTKTLPRSTIGSAADC